MSRPPTALTLAAARTAGSGGLVQEAALAGGGACQFVPGWEIYRGWLAGRFAAVEVPRALAKAQCVAEAVCLRLNKCIQHIDATLSGAETSNIFNTIDHPARSGSNPFNI